MKQSYKWNLFLTTSLFLKTGKQNKYVFYIKDVTVTTALLKLNSLTKKTINI